MRRPRSRGPSEAPGPLVGLTAAALLVAACSSHRHDWLDPSRLPDDVRSDYAVFAARCSKCHSLSRPLDSGIDDDGHWRLYVARMRRQPASGISRDDVAPILRFLHYFSLEERRRKGKLPPEPPAVPASPVAPVAPVADVALAGPPPGTDAAAPTVPVPARGDGAEGGAGP